MGTVRAEPALWEAFLAAGGAAFDTARHYGDVSEDGLGRFLERHAVRRQVYLVGKGAHTPTCAPEHVAPQLERSLELLRSDHLDLYLLHRDDPGVPVDAWLDALTPHLEAGHVRAIGASNWTPSRVEALNAAASRRGVAGFTAVSNQLSLAEMHEPVWDGCLRADPGWHEQTRTPLLAWSAQARGFFAGGPDDHGELRRCWQSAANGERLRRAGIVARRLRVPPVAVALAWLCAQPFPVHPVVGPRDTAELDACLAADRIALEPDIRSWLDLEEVPFG